MEYSYIDIHSHIHFADFDEDREAVLARMKDAGVATITVGTDSEKSQGAIALAEAHPNIYATVGVHPIHVHEERNFDNLKKLASAEKVVAIGECGFDYFRVEKETKAKQEEVFLAHIALANEVGKPLMLHIRDVAGSMSAYEDALVILKAYAKVLGNVHFFAGTYDIAKQFWDMGFTTSFTGVITFASQYDETIRNAPLAMLHAETDAPYVAPVPFRGRRNEPIYVREVYKRIAEIRSEDAEVVRMTLLQNAQRVFGM